MIKYNYWQIWINNMWEDTVSYDSSMSEEEVLSAVTLQYIESGMAYCGVHDFLNRSRSFELDNYLKDDFPDDVGKWWDYIWLEEEVEAERSYQKEQAL